MRLPLADHKFPDLENATLEEIEAMQAKLTSYLERRLQAKKQGAIDKIRSLTYEHELRYDEVLAAILTTTRRGKAPALYRNPEKPRQTWSGKGEAPGWFKNHPDPESLRIPGT
jgi:DNA-binding protein H-NS